MSDPTPIAAGATANVVQTATLHHQLADDLVHVPTG